MSRWRIIVVIGLVLFPFLFFAAAGSYYLWTLRWGFFAWWPLALCMALGYTLGWYWQRQRLLLHPPDFSAPRHWTEQDNRAWQLIQAQCSGSRRALRGEAVQHRPLSNDREGDRRTIGDLLPSGHNRSGQQPDCAGDFDRR